MEPALDGPAEAAVAQAVPDLGLETVVAGAGGHLDEVVAQRAAIVVYGMVVVVQDHEQVGLGHARIVHALERQAAGEGAVADDGDHLLRPALQPGRFREAECGGNGGGGMPHPEGVVLAFADAGETADPARSAYVPEGLPAAGDDLVGVCLVAYVQHKLVGGGVEHVMHAHDEFDGPEAGGEVSRVAGATLHHVGTDLPAKLFELRDGKALDVGRAVDLVQDIVHPYKRRRQRYDLFQ